MGFDYGYPKWHSVLIFCKCLFLVGFFFFLNNCIRLQTEPDKIFDMCIFLMCGIKIYCNQLKTELNYEKLCHGRM